MPEKIFERKYVGEFEIMKNGDILCVIDGFFVIAGMDLFDERMDAFKPVCESDIFFFDGDRIEEDVVAIDAKDGIQGYSVFPAESVKIRQAQLLIAPDTTISAVIAYSKQLRDLMHE